MPAAPSWLLCLLLPACLGADTLGFIEQKFTDLHFEKSKWTRTAQPPCFTYTAQVDGARVEVLRYGMGNLVPFRATAKGLMVTVCGSVAVFDEGFEAQPEHLNTTSGTDGGKTNGNTHQP